MNKKIMLLALGAVSAILLALPALASAQVALHLNPTPVTGDVSGGHAVLRTSAFSVTCNSVTGDVKFNAGGTTGTMQLTFGGHCQTVGVPGGGTCTSSNPAEPSGNITTTVLPFDLVTLTGKKPGVLVTPGENNSFAHFNCPVFGFPVQTTVTGNGVLGTITSPGCGGVANTATFSFEESGTVGVQKHQTVEGTATVYNLKKGEENATQKATATVTLTDGAGKHVSSELVCT